MIKDMKDFEKAFHKAYLSQQNLEFNDENVEMSSSEGKLSLLHETDGYWLVLNELEEPNCQIDFINLIHKDTYKMESLEY